MTIPDEKLSAFLDGELGPAEAAEIEAAAKADPALGSRLDALDAATRRFAAAIGAIDDAPAPASVEALLRPKPDNVVAFRKPKRDAPGWRAPAAIAASLLAIVVAVGLFGAQPGGGERMRVATGPVERTSPLHRALDRTPGAEWTEIGKARVSPVATFRIAGGAPCREFIATEERRAVRAVACRDDRQWTIKIAAEEAAPGAGYQPASAAGAAIGAFIDGAIEGDALGPDDERALIAAKWKRAP